MPPGAPGRVPGSVSWEEFMEAWMVWHRRYGHGRAAAEGEGIADRGGFSYNELTIYSGHEPKTWKPRPA